MVRSHLRGCVGKELFLQASSTRPSATSLDTHRLRGPGPWDRHGIIDWLSVPPSIAASGELCRSPFHSRPPIPMIECFKGAGFRNLLYSSKNCQRKH